jgi:hypothetical protein
MNLRYVPEKHACIHTIVINNYQPEVCKLTLPNLKAYADRIGADFNIIDKRVFDKYPIYFEEFQVYEMGKNYKYNMVLNADFIMHTDVPDFTKDFNLNFVGAVGSIPLANCFKPNNYFKRSGMKNGISDSILATTYLTHDVWTPPEYTYDEIRGECKKEIQATEFCLSLNMAKFGISYTQLFKKKCTFYHAGATFYNKTKKPEELIKENLELWKLWEKIK